MEEQKIVEEKIIISEDLIQKFAQFANDFNPIHFDDEAAKKKGFKGRIAHGMLTASLFSGMMATKFPGPGTIYLNQTFKFHAPIYLNDKITLRLELISVKEGKPIFTIKTEALDEEGTLKISGEAIVKAPSQYQKA